jgi:hypothetical protein
MASPRSRSATDEPRRPPEARLAWAFVAEGATETGDRISREVAGTRFPLVPVTDYAHLSPAARPPAYCPACLERVVLRLGARNRHHYGHRPASTCAAAGGEGALHLAAKLHLAERLAGASGALRIRRVCARVPEERSAERCERALPEAWPVAWDAVAVEYALPAARADLMLLCEGREVGAVEVHVSSAVDEARAAKYRALGIPWIEVPGAALLPERGLPWTPERPLPVLQDSAHPQPWRCPRHEGLFRGMQEHRESGTHLLAGRVVHLYRADGGRSTGEPRVRRLLVHMLERREEGEMVEAWLERADTHRRLGGPVRTRDRAEARRALHRRFADWARWMRDARGAAVDSPMRWAPPAALEGWEASGAYPERLRWDALAGRFAAAPNLRAVAWPRVPHRPGEPDPVLGHPACAWSEPHPGGAPTLHATHGAVWATLRVRGRTPAGEVAHLAAHLHDGARWRTLAGAPYLATRAGADALAWTRLLAAFARALAAEPPETLLSAPSCAAWLPPPA